MAIPSLALIPTGYKDGKLYSVLPESGVGDFDVVRGSGATRVNKDGLIEDVRILSGELISDGSFDTEGVELVVGGDFSNPSDWILTGTNLSIVNGKGVSTGSNFSAQFQQQILTTNKTYKLVFDIVDYTSGAMSLESTYYGVLQAFNSVGTHTAYFTSLSQAYLKLYSQNFIGSIDNVSVKEVAADWSLGTGWSVGEDKAVCDNSGSGSRNLRQNNIATIGKTYKITLDADITSGFPYLVFGGTTAINSGANTFYKVATSTDIQIRNSSSNFIGSITNISVIEITEDTDIPRIDYTDGGCPSLLLEPQSTNLIDYSEDLSSWSGFGSPIRTGGQDDLSGNTNAYKVEFPTTNDFIRRVGVSTIGTFTASIYAKKSIGDDFYFNIDSNVGRYNFSTGLFTAGAGAPTGEMIDLGNGWYRCTMTFSSTNASSQVRLQSDSGSTVVLWGAQLEALPYSTSYIPTSGASATRLADSVTGAGDVNTFNSTEGVLYAEIAALANDGTFRLISLNDGTTNNTVYIGYDASSNRITFAVRVATSFVFLNNYDISNATDVAKIALKYKENDFALWYNGTEVSKVTSGAVFSTNTLTKLGFDRVGSLPFYGKVKDLRVFNTALTDAELQTLTTI